jgi:RNA polymerase sigma-70 factor (ECF subfamily)
MANKHDDGSRSGVPTREAELVERLEAGDDAAFETLVRENTGTLLAVARRYLRNEEDARDAVQEGFLAAFRGIDRFEGTSKISTWLHRIVVNQALMKLRTRRRKPEESIERMLPTFLEDGHQSEKTQPWVAESAHALLEREEIRNAVREAIDKLPDNYRAVILLRDFEQLSGEEAGRLLGITANAVKIRLHRARQALRGLLDPKLVAEAP